MVRLLSYIAMLPGRKNLIGRSECRRYFMNESSDDVVRPYRSSQNKSWQDFY